MNIAGPSVADDPKDIEALAIKDEGLSRVSGIGTSAMGFSPQRLHFPDENEYSFSSNADRPCVFFAGGAGGCPYG